MEYFAQVSQQAIDAKPPYRGVVSMLHFGEYILIKSEICGEIERRWFHQNNPIYYYHMSREERLPIVHAMYLAGCSIAEIAEMMGFSSSTISNDVQRLPEGPGTRRIARIIAKDVTPPNMVLKSTINQKPQSFTPQYTDSY